MTEQEQNYLRQVGQKIARLRRDHGYSQMDICGMIDMEKPNLSSIENGRQNFTTLTLLKIANAIGVEVREFFEP